MKSVDVIVVGAGPAGIGMAMGLNKITGLEFGVVESEGVGASFQNWPAQTRFITPSFNSNPYGLADLNSVDPLTSPAAYSQTQHPSGQHYQSTCSLWLTRTSCLFCAIARSWTLTSETMAIFNQRLSKAIYRPGSWSGRAENISSQTSSRSKGAGYACTIRKYPIGRPSKHPHIRLSGVIRAA